jgi:ABC-type multidrug transport system permease subunit
MNETDTYLFFFSETILSQFFSELPFHLISPLVLGTIVYWMAHLRPEFARFMAFMGIITLESIAAVALGMAISSVSSSAEVATILANPISVVMLISGGFYISIQSLPAAAQWVADLSLMKWSFQALVVNEFEGTTLTCTEQDRHCLATGAEAIASIGFAGSTVWDGAAGLIVLTLALNFIAYTIMRYNKPRYQSLLAATTAFPTDGPETDLNTSKTR